MEAEQSSNNREHPVVFGQKRVKMGVGQSDVFNYTLCHYFIQVHLFLVNNATGAPVLGQGSKIKRVYECIRVRPGKK